MHEQNRHRLREITARHARRNAATEPAGDTAFLEAFRRAREEILRLLMEEVRAQLAATGYASDLTVCEVEGKPTIEFHIVIPGRGDSKDIIRWFARRDAARGWQVIAELELKGSPVELTRFSTVEEITRDVAELLVVDAVEQMFASSGAR